MELSEYLLLVYTSSLTLSIAGVFKEVCTLYLAVRYTGDHMTTVNFIGLIVCLIGITLHVVLKGLHSNDEKEYEGWQRLLDKSGVDLEEEEEDVIFETSSTTSL
ncbi:Solute carrier family 35 member C2, partial [Stegodyphus mimosarum]